MSIWPIRFAVPVNKVQLIALVVLLSICFASEVTIAEIIEQSEVQTSEVMPVTSTDIDIGVTFPNANIDVVSTLKNIGDKAISVVRIVPRWASTESEISFEKTTLSPSDTMDIRFKIKNHDNVGRFSHIFFVYSNGSGEPVGKIAIRGFIDWVVDPSSTSIDVGALSYQESIERTLRPKSRPGESVALTNISTQNKWFEAKIVEKGAALLIKNRKGMPWGAFDELIVVDTDNALQPKVTFHVKGEVRGAIIPSMSTIDFGVIREGKSVEQAVRLEGEAGKKIEVGRIEITGAKATAAMSECIPAVVSCKLLKLRLDDQAMGRAPRGVVSISFPDYDATLPILFGGALIGKDTVVRDLAKEVEAAKDSSAGISSALRAATSTPVALEMPVPEGRGPLLKWEMANESRIFGYEIYRSTESGGPYSRADRSIIPRLSSDAAVRSIYRWRDSGAVPGKEYWYYIGVVYLDGRKENLNSAQKVMAK